MLQNAHLCGYVLYRGSCVCIEEGHKVSTAVISGYPSCIIPEVCGGIDLI